METDRRRSLTLIRFKLNLRHCPRWRAMLAFAHLPAEESS